MTVLEAFEPFEDHWRPLEAFGWPQGSGAAQEWKEVKIERGRKRFREVKGEGIREREGMRESERD